MHTFIRPGHVNAYGLRKGSATLCATGTTCPPPLASILRRGEWSMGIVLDIYFNFAQGGDCYVGRLLNGGDPNHKDFARLPPHWTVIDAMAHPDIKEAMEMMYGTLLKKYEGEEKDPKGKLLRALPSFIWYFDSIFEFAQKVG